MNSRILYQYTEKLRTILKERKTEFGKQTMCCVILDKHGKPLSYGFNSYVKSHPYMKSFSRIKHMNNSEFKIYLHCEMDAMIKAFSKISKWNTMIIARLGANNKLRLAKPCIGCHEMIKGKFANVYYTDNSENLVLEKF